MINTFNQYSYLVVKAFHNAALYHVHILFAAISDGEFTIIQGWDDRRVVVQYLEKAQRSRKVDRISFAFVNGFIGGEDF